MEGTPLGEQRKEWIDSLGGPLVMLPTSALAKWRGSFGASEVGVGQPPAGTSHGGTDYDWACSMNDLIAVRNFCGDVAVVLNDHPLPTTWRQISSTEGVVARAFVADQPRDVLSGMVSNLTDADRNRLLAQDDVIDRMAQDISEGESAANEYARALKTWARSESARLQGDFCVGQYTIFDSVEDGTDLRESLTIRLDPGSYEVLSGWHRVDAENTFVLHWIKSVRGN